TKVDYAATILLSIFVLALVAINYQLADRYDRGLVVFYGVNAIIVSIFVGRILDKILFMRKNLPVMVDELSDVLSKFEVVKDFVQRYHEEMEQDVQTRFQQRWDEIQAQYARDLNELKQQLNIFVQEVETEVPSWQNSFWRHWTPVSKMAPLQRIGALHLGDTALEMPALLHFPGPRSILLKARAETRKRAVQGVQSWLLQLLTHLPPGQVRFTFIDPVGLGQNVAPFMSLERFDKQMITHQAWSEPARIEQRLAELTEHMENVIQKYLQNRFPAIEDYNAQADVPEAYRFIVIFDFPTNFTEDALRRLQGVIENGPRCGVFAIILADMEKIEVREQSARLHGLNLNMLERNCTVISGADDHFIWEDDNVVNCTLELDAPPDKQLFEHLLNSIGRSALEAGKVEVPFDRIAPPFDAWWTSDSRFGIQTPLGPTGAGKFQELCLGQDTSQHALVVGRTGSGKSTLLHVLITNLALIYSPDEVQLYLVDFKKGVEFKSYATYALPHARVVAIESEREFGLSVLGGLDAELKRRGEFFREAGVDHIADYRERTGARMPRILLIVDEFQEFFSEDDRVASQAAQILDRLVRQGRAFGVHVLLGSQTLAGGYTLARSTIDQMAVRIALQCTDADSRLILADDNPAARRLTRPGEAIYNDTNGLVEGNHFFQVAWLPDDERERYLKRIQFLGKQQGYHSTRSQIVFEGNAPALVANNMALSQLLSAPGWSPSHDSVPAWLGEPIAIKSPTAANFRRQTGSNLIILGRNDEAAMGMMLIAILSFAAQLPQVQFIILDFASVNASYAKLLSRLVDELPHPVQYGRRRQLSDLIARVAAEVDRRLGLDEIELLKEPSMHLIIFGLQRARDLRRAEDFVFMGDVDKEQSSDPAKQFARILQEGPEVGVHTLAWCDTYANLVRTLEPRVLEEFEMKVAMQMREEDSIKFIGEPVANRLGAYRAYYYNEAEGYLEKFRPYAPPPKPWLDRAWKQLRDKDSVEMPSMLKSSVQEDVRYDDDFSPMTLKLSSNTIGKYLILDTVASNRVATVYRAEDPTLHRVVALKVLAPYFTRDAKWVQRFYAWVQTVSRLEHPHIVAVYHAGQHDDHLYVVSRFIEGSSLADRLKHDGPLTWNAVVNLLEEIASALDYAHQRGVHHQGLKPSNILLDSHGVALVTDFGFDAMIDAHALGVTIRRDITSAAAYIAPEIWMGKESAPQTDTYALGCILYEMVIGEKYFSGKTTPDVMQAHFQPREFPNVWPKGVPPRLTGVLNTALSINAALRFRSPGEMAKAVSSLPEDRLAAPYALLHQAMRAGHWKQALTLIDEIKSIDPGYRDVVGLEKQVLVGMEQSARRELAAIWRSKAEKAYTERDWQVAKLAIEQWLRLIPEDPEALERKAELSHISK
ncbi:MAG: protein kinase, partial [Chloroflexi bacterium]|nr:protein kinase [Chloroflexota bacterium]